MDKKQKISSKIFGYYESDHFTFDFRGKKVKLQINDGKSKVEDKFSLGHRIGMINYHRGLCADIHTYAECKQILLELLEEKNYSNVTIIK